MPPSYLAIASLKNLVGGNAEFTTVKLDVVNCLIQIFLQTHNLQRIIFRIFCHQSSKMISNKARTKNKTWLDAELGHTTFFSSSTDRDKRLLNIKSTFPFFSRCYWRSFLHKSISLFSCCVSFLNVSFISSVGFHDSSASYHQ